MNCVRGTRYTERHNLISCPKTGAHVAMWTEVISVQCLVALVSKAKWHQDLL